VTYTHLAGKVLAEALRGQAERFDAFAGLPHYPFPGGQMLRVPFSAIGAWYYSLRDRLGLIRQAWPIAGKPTRTVSETCGARLAAKRPAQQRICSGY
jgi:hypothetical protein